MQLHTIRAAGFTPTVDAFAGTASNFGSSRCSGASRACALSGPGS